MCVGNGIEQGLEIGRGDATPLGLLAAACGSRVVKHGNRSVSSKSGSADMLECLGMPLPLHAKEAVDCLQATSFTFLFAPAYHPAMKAVVPVRGALGVRTVFNMLGPLTNPAAPPYSLIGAFSLPMAKLAARRSLAKMAPVSAYMDEVSHRSSVSSNLLSS